MTPQEITQRFLKAGINVIEVHGPVFQIGKDRVSALAGLESWSLVQNMEHGDLRLVELQTYSEIKTVCAKTIRLDDGRIVAGQVKETDYSGRFQTTEDDLIIALIDKIISSMNSRYLFVYIYPTVTTHPINIMNSFTYEVARMEHGMDEKIFSLSDIKESKLTAVFARIYYDGI